MRIGAVIVAAGRGERAGGGLPKQYRPLAGRRILTRTLDTFLAHEAIADVVVVTAAVDAAYLAEVERELGHKLITATGGTTRTASVRAGLEKLAGRGVDAVMIHDAARPFASAALIARLAEALATNEAVIPALASTDALMRLDTDGALIEPVARDEIFAAQTPQAFRLAPLMAAYAGLGETALPDDAAAIRRAGGAVWTVPGEADNFKLTRPEDFRRAEAMLMSRAITVTGQGFDVHRLEPAEAMWLCGVEIRAGLGLVGHSDADAGLHALTDAILGAAGAGDIGEHFPPTDPQWRGASSDRFVEHALGLLTAAGGELMHADITLIAERPKIAPHKAAMKARLAQMLGLAPDRVNIKATTTEGLGFTGRGEGLAAQAVVTARLVP